ncbi:tyrosine-type recombinase/integrase [Mesorhizobium captivum]|uniref:tyrosine-type recombinase/integrase n=1 Tax=Mesorhizobium captivum TaxID=3072319 RepID=UPI002A242552|nr:tyrosine-type recombinase/integrase [Mesorhizobium sp. VK3C]MDX8450889.1 tyrosine-type recombinase/integrase [Mesorhizobium sp. VK3C]
MFEDLFAYPKVVARHHDGPEASKRLRYLKHLADQGAARETLLRTARELLVIAERLDLSGGRCVRQAEIDVAAQSWARYQHARNRAWGEKWSRRLFHDVAAAWLCFLGQLDEPAPNEPKVHCEKVDDFIAYQHDERGLSAITLANQRWQVETFLEHLSVEKSSIADITVADVDAFLDVKGRGGWSRVSVATSAHALRAFFRHAQRRQWCCAGIAAAIDAPRLFREEALPMGPAWPDVQRLLESTSDRTARDVRDHAILKLLAIYGLRSGEVRGLCLEDFDWTREVIKVTRSKQRKTQYYPLVTSVGDAVVRYLQLARPRCRRHEVFLTLKAPFQPLSASAVYHVVASRLRALGVQSMHFGPHGLRHACATHLVAQGLSLKEIGDHLGHRSAFATRTYARVDLAGLREVGAFDLGGLA